MTGCVVVETRCQVIAGRSGARCVRPIGHAFAHQFMPPSKDEAPCCLSQRDDHGRLPIGYCGPGCIRRRS